MTITPNKLPSSSIAAGFHRGGLALGSALCGRIQETIGRQLMRTFAEYSWAAQSDGSVH
jgi:hypothetical protein